MPVITKIKGCKHPVFMSGRWLVKELKAYLPEGSFESVETVGRRKHKKEIAESFESETVLVYFESPGAAETVAYCLSEADYYVLSDALESVCEDNHWEYTTESVDGDVSLVEELAYWGGNFSRKEVSECKECGMPVWLKGPKPPLSVQVPQGMLYFCCEGCLNEYELRSK